MSTLQERFKDDARHVRRMLREAVDPVGKHGTNAGVCDTKSEQQDATYVVARVDRGGGWSA